MQKIRKGKVVQRISLTTVNKMQSNKKKVTQRTNGIKIFSTGCNYYEKTGFVNL